MLNIDLNLKVVNLEKLEHMHPDFIKINPQHKVPVIVEEDGFTLSESRAILTYFVEKYAKNSTLYPEDLRARAIINHRLYFDIGTLYRKAVDYYLPIWKKGAPPDPYKAAKLDEALQLTSFYLQDQYFAGPELTIADISLAGTISCMIDCKIDLKYENIKRWYENMKSTALGFEEAFTKNSLDVTKIKRF